MASDDRPQIVRVVIREEDEGRYDRYPKRSVEKGTAVNRQREDRTTFGVKRKEWPRATTRDEDGIQLSAKDREPLDSRRMKRSDEEGLAADRVGKVQKTFEAKRRQWPGTITRGEEDESRYNRQTEARSDQAPRSGRTRISDLKIEYTTPASDFIYGTSSVLAALKAGRRKCYKLYVTEASENRPVSLDTLEKFASLRGAKVVLVKPNQIGSLDKASKGRPHNGLILEASPLPIKPIHSLLQVLRPQQSFQIGLSYQSEEEKLVNGEDPEVHVQDPERYPFVIMLDGINNGWEVYAAVAPPDLDNPQTKQDRRYLFATQLSKPLLGSPCLLLLGEEGAGLRRDLVQKADHLISIGGPRRGQAGLDSLNVSVAAALLCEAFLRKPSEPSSLPDYPTLGVDGDERLF
ncbi:MAG: hypothetical protein LQ340_005147 [Diploschistes diacapsis]|nr:MAG: hypothetical protein LQ340_005147 [Diploschistes diacapsis]